MQLGRLLTRTGDQAWDFAVPLVLLKLMPGDFQVTAFYYFLVRLAHVIFLPRLTSLIDRINRFQAAKIGISLQLFGVVVGLLSIYTIYFGHSSETMQRVSLPVFVALVLGGILSSLGSTFMDIAIANDLVPSAILEGDLSHFNSRLRQIDLLTEVSAPILAGLLLAWDYPEIPLVGFLLVGLWNIISFFPEYRILKSIFRIRPDLMAKQIEVAEQARVSLFRKFIGGWRSFFREPVALAVLAYAFLWLSVLSPHGVLLTAYLKDGWHLPEWAIGTFRGLGALFGIIATVTYPRVTSKFGLVRGSQAFIVIQAGMVALAIGCFFVDSLGGQIGFMGFILFSRVGLYGFSLGEMQIRQIGIRQEVRGQVNGFANALTGIATLGLYGAGAMLPNTDDFRVLIVGSAAFVFLAAGIYSYWARIGSQRIELAK